jgi:hypothetical protein
MKQDKSVSSKSASDDREEQAGQPMGRTRPKDPADASENQRRPPPHLPQPTNNTTDRALTPARLPSG